MPITTQRSIRRLAPAVLFAALLAAAPAKAADPGSDPTKFQPASAKQPSVTLYTPAPVESRPHPHKKRWKKAWIASWVAFAVVNALDTHSSLGRRELNPLLRDSNGRFDAKKALILKSAIGGGFFAVQWWLSRKNPDRNYYKAFSLANTAATTGLGVVAVRNYGLEGPAEQSTNAGANEYLNAPEHE